MYCPELDRKRRIGFVQLEFEAGLFPSDNETFTPVAPLEQRTPMFPDERDANVAFTPMGSYEPKSMLDVELISHTVSTKALNVVDDDVNPLSCANTGDVASISIAPNIFFIEHSNKVGASV